MPRRVPSRRVKSLGASRVDGSASSGSGARGRAVAASRPRRALRDELTTLPSARPRVRGASQPMTLPRSRASGRAGRRDRPRRRARRARRRSAARAGTRRGSRSRPPPWREVLAATGAVGLDGLAALLDLARQHAEDLVLGQLAALPSRRCTTALEAMRSTSRRSASPDRIAAVVSAWIRSRRVTGSGTSGAVPRRAGRPAGRELQSVSLPASGGLLALRFLALALHAGLLVVLASASLGEDAALLDLLVEASQGTLEGLVLAYSDFSQSRFTSSGHDLHADSCSRGQPATTAGGV